jgi:DNA processing protein
MSVGPHRLIRDQEAVLVRDAADVLEVLGPLGQHIGSVGARELGVGPLDGPGDRRDAARPTDGLGPDLQAVHEALARRAPRSVGEVARRAGMPEGEVLGLLGELDLRGLAARVDGGWTAPAQGSAGRP